MAKIVKRKTNHANVVEAQDQLVIIDFEGDLYFLTMSDVEEEIQRYYSMREKLRQEKKLRKENETLKELYSQYKVMLKLLSDEDKKNEKRR